MTGHATRRRFTIALAVVALGAMSGCPAPTTTPAPPPTRAHSLSTMLPYVPGANLMLTISNPAYNASSVVNSAQIKNPDGASCGWWKPKSTMGQAVNGTSITVVFDTTILPQDPMLSGHPPAGPLATISTGAIVCIHTNLGDTADPCPPPPNQIKINPVLPNSVAPCP